MKDSTIDFEVDQPEPTQPFEPFVEDEEFTVPTMHLASDDLPPIRSVVHRSAMTQNYARDLPIVAVPLEVMAWAKGCKQCGFGLVGAPDAHGRCSLHTERKAQAHAGALVFCTCRAGIAAQRFYGGL